MHCFQPEIAPGPVGFLAHLGKPLSHSSVANPHFRCNRPNACPFRAEPKDFVTINDPGWAAKLLPRCSCVAETGTDPFADKVAFKLSHGGDNCKKCLTKWTARIHIFLVRDELD